MALSHHPKCEFLERYVEALVETMDLRGHIAAKTNQHEAVGINEPMPSNIGNVKDMRWHT
jgi:hypothetical protein